MGVTVVRVVGKGGLEQEGGGNSVLRASQSYKEMKSWTLGGQ